MKKWIFLLLAIACETLATSTLKSSDGFSKLWPSIITIVGYAASFYFLSIALKVFPIGIAYAIWSGVGVVLITSIGWLIYGQSLDMPALLGIGLIVAGVIVMNIFSSTIGH